jgi:hypothetical protein
MRYLYGDSVPFPPQYDFLAALDAFCTHAARVVRCDAESRALRTSAEAAAAQRSKAVEELEAFHTEAVTALREGAKDSAQSMVIDYVHQLSDLAQRIADDARRSAVQAAERDAQITRAESNKRSADVRDALEKLLVAVRVPVVETQITMSLVDGRNELSATFCHPGELVAAFTLAADESEDWKAPRQVRHFAQNVSLPVGVKRSLFKRTVAPETIVLDEYVLGGFELRDDGAVLRLRKRAEHADSLVFDLKRLEDRVTAEVHHPDDAEAESGLAAVLDQSSAAEVERLWQLVRSACASLLSRKRRLVRLTLGGESVFENERSTDVVRLIVGGMAPVVSEVSRRSPNSHELSLKVENEAGRREEIYLRKAQLVAVLATVPSDARRVFDPLGLASGSGSDLVEIASDEVVVFRD